MSIVNNIVTLSVSSVQSSVGVLEFWLVEWLWLVKSVSVLGSNNISVSILFSLPRGLVEQLGICLESTCDSAHSSGLPQLVIEFTFSDSQFLKSVWFASIIWV